MATDTINTVQEEINPSVELLNQTCLDLVNQIKRLKKENSRLKKVAGETEKPGGE